MQSRRRKEPSVLSHSTMNFKQMAVTLALCVTSFFAGTLISMHSTVSNLHACTDGGLSVKDVEAMVSKRLQEGGFQNNDKECWRIAKRLDSLTLVLFLFVMVNGKNSTQADAR